MTDRLHVPRGTIMGVLLALALVLSLVVAQTALATDTTQKGNPPHTNGSSVTVNGLDSGGTRNVGTAAFNFTLGNVTGQQVGYCIDLGNYWNDSQHNVTATASTPGVGTDDAALAWILARSNPLPPGTTAHDVTVNQVAVWVLSEQVNATTPTNDSTLNGQVAALITKARAATAATPSLGVAITPPAPGATTAQVTVTGPADATVTLSVSGPGTLSSTSFTLDASGTKTLTLTGTGLGQVTVTASATTGSVASTLTLTKIWPKTAGATQGTATATSTPVTLGANAKVTFTAKPTLTVEKVVENGGRYGDLSDIAFSVLAQQSGDQMNNVDFTPLFAGPSNTRTKDLVAGTTYTMQESSNPRGFELKDISCHEGEAATSDASSDTATFTPQPNEHWYCTVTNVYNPPTVTVNKVVVDAAGNVVTPKDGASFTANLTGTPSITGLVANGAASAPRTLDAGTTYTLAEGAMPNANYAAKGAPVCTLTNPVEQTPAVVESANTFTPGLGDIWNCTITNVYTPPVTPPAPPVTPPAPPVTPEGTPAPEVDANAVAPRPAKAVLAITKTGPKKAQVMKAFTYTIRVRNTSTTVARNVIVRDTLPAGMIKISTSPKATQKGRVLTIKLGNLKPKATRTITVKVKFAANVRGARTNIATASADNAKTVKAKATTKVTAPAKRVVKPAVTG